MFRNASCLWLKKSLLLLVGACCVPLGVAQDLRTIQPKPVPPQVEAPAPAAESPAAPTAPGDETAMVEALKGLVFIAESAQVVANPAVPANGIDAGRVPMLQSTEAREALAPFLGKPVSMASLNRIVATVNAVYAKAGRPFVSVGLPEQDITSGVVQVLVVEGVLGAVSVEGNKYFSEKHYLSQMRLAPGAPLCLADLQKDVDWINNNPFRAGNFFVKPGKSEAGTTDLVFRVKERMPIRLTAGINNHGTENTGEERLESGITWGNAFGLGHLVSYQITTNTDVSDYVGHSGTYTAPLPWRHTLALSASYSSTRSRLPAPFDQRGRSSQLSLSYQVPLPTLKAYTHSVSALFDFKTSDNNLDFSDVPVTDNETNIFQWGLQYAGSCPDRWGATSGSIRAYYSPGDLNSKNDNDSFTISRADADAEYAYAALNLTRSQRLPLGFSLSLRGCGQVADGNLLGSEQMSVGGFSSVRGYDEGDSYGDQGYILTEELRSPPLNPARWLRIPNVADQLVLYVFHDQGLAQLADPLPGEDRDTKLQSVGLGLDYAVGRYFSLSCSYGWQLRETDGSEENSRGHIAATLSF